ncbi:Uncharacterized protein Adt_20706 [Abeliophyllum distichum]|uniref:DUF1985 domain-containing protein n=1 Tax=Abeliophyllum distichum TaxID=126358 RepID=A0ABD1SXD7_9LAMI
MLLMEVKYPKKDEMWFKISRKVLRFSVEEFCVITGLKCIGCDDLSKMKSRHPILRQRYFNHLKCIYKKEVEDVFKSLLVNSADEDVVKIRILYLITSFLFTTPYKKQVTDATFSLVEYVDIETYAWEKELFKNTFSYVKIAMTKRTYDETTKNDIFTYRLYRFLLSFQIWIYESVPSIDKKKIQKLEIQGIKPNEEERGATYLSRLFQINRVVENIDDVDDDDFVDPLVRLHKSFNPDPFRGCNESKSAKNVHI